jgi:ParB family transcriptional regulator, chromosome partitioning protein
MTDKTTKQRGKLPSMVSKLGGAIDLNQREKIVELEAQVVELKAQGAGSNDGLTVVEISVDDICPSQNPRTILNQESIQTIANHIDRNGQDNPISIYPNPTGSPKYLIEDGKRRWHGVKYLGQTTIKATIKAAPRDPVLAALTTFTHHEDLHPLDFAETLMTAIGGATQLESDRVLKILARVVMRLSRQNLISELNQLANANTLDQMQGLETLGIIDVEERAVISFLLKEGLKPSSVRSNLFSMLLLPADLTAAIHQYGINSNIALALTGISAKNLNTDDSIAQGERVKAMQIVIDENLSLRETRSLVNQIKTKYQQPIASIHTETCRVTVEIEQLVDTVIDRATADEIDALRQLLTRKLAQLGVT